MVENIEPLSLRVYGVMQLCSIKQDRKHQAAIQFVLARVEMPLPCQSFAASCNAAPASANLAPT
jgi:hypothetical protein